MIQILERRLTMSVKNTQTMSHEEIAIEISDKIREDWDWQISSRVIRWDNSPSLEVLCGTAIHTQEFNEYVEKLLIGLPAEKCGMSGTGIVIETGEEVSDEDLIILSEHHHSGGDYETEEGETVIYP